MNLDSGRQRAFSAAGFASGLPTKKRPPCFGRRAAISRLGMRVAAGVRLRPRDTVRPAEAGINSGVRAPLALQKLSTNPSAANNQRGGKAADQGSGRAVVMALTEMKATIITLIGKCRN